ncbi:MAG: RICIN domain-containing protein [Coriobacteriales bacterium]|nr:RICIN domain-containing protein [Coriobacteriales bacterium]
MDLNKLILTNNRCYKAGKKITPKGIMVHSTGANNPELRRYVNPDDGRLGKNLYNNHWNIDSPNLSVCVHAFIGRLANGNVATYQTLPWDHRGWHCASGPLGSGNDTHISFEICEDGLTNHTYFESVWREAVELCAYLCKMYDFNPLALGVLIDHSEGHIAGISSNHADIRHWFIRHVLSMDNFRHEVAKMIDSQTPDPFGRTVWLYETNGTYAQDWILRPCKDGSYSFESVANGLMLDARGNRMEPGNDVWAYPNNGTDAQRWHIKAITGGLTPTVSAHPFADHGLALDIEGNRHESGTRIQLWEVNNTRAQEFTLVFRGLTPEGDVVVTLIHCDSNKAIDLKHGGK